VQEGSCQGFLLRILKHFQFQQSRQTLNVKDEYSKFCLHIMQNTVVFPKQVYTKNVRLLLIK
ncbi:hypothetical protein, partial [Agathobaculum sp.]|uniref:hypothetical protein n=1 Tax=Agathobaculum sp. TaxID=2048138 RepID=UPI003A92AC7E